MIPSNRSNREHQEFFGVIAGRNLRYAENYLSRLFRACFMNSPVFAQAVLNTIWNEGRLRGPGRVPKAEKWECVYQPATPMDGGGRPDLCLRPASQANLERTAIHQPIWLESKVGSRLSKEQLRRYKDHKTHILVAITKNWPEVTKKELNQEGVKSLRWQDICRALRQTKCRGTDQFLCDAFAKYLEENGMAYREDITEKHLKDLRVLLAKVSNTSSHGEVVPRAGFGIAHNCLELLGDVRRLLQELHPQLAKWRVWGPGYTHEQFEDGSISEHHLGFGLFKIQRSWNDCHIYCGFSFPVSEPAPCCYLEYWNNGKSQEIKYPGMSRILSKKSLDAHKIARVVSKFAASWKII